MFLYFVVFNFGFFWILEFVFWVLDLFDFVFLILLFDFELV